MDLLRDIFNSHKVFMFGSFQCAQYSLKSFYEDIKKAEAKIFGKAMISPHIIKYEIYHEYASSKGRFQGVEQEIVETQKECISDRLFQTRFALHPQWLVADDMFRVFQYHFAVSQWINDLKKEDVGKSLNVFCCAIPKKVVSLYDDEVEYEHSVDEIEEWMTAKTMDIIQCIKYKDTKLDIVDIVQRIKESMKSMNLRDLEFLVLLFDRRNLAMTEDITFFVFQCQTIEDVVDLTKNHFIGMHFNMSWHRDNSKWSKCWLHYGNGQRLRFWAEQLVWFIPRLFVKGKQSGYQFAKRLYSDDFKHGFCLNLNDPIFDKYYHILTGYEHRTVNYRRSAHSRTNILRFGFRDFVEWNLNGSTVFKLIAFWVKNGYSTDDILEDISGPGVHDDSNVAEVFDKDTEGLNELVSSKLKYEMSSEANCTIDHPKELWQCHFVQAMIQNLQEFHRENFEIHAGNISEFDATAIIRGLDHLTVVHNVFSIENKRRIRHFFTKQIRCDLGGECKALLQHCRGEGRLTAKVKKNKMKNRALWMKWTRYWRSPKVL